MDSTLSREGLTSTYSGLDKKQMEELHSNMSTERLQELRYPLFCLQSHLLNMSKNAMQARRLAEVEEHQGLWKSINDAYASVNREIRSRKRL